MRSRRRRKRLGQSMTEYLIMVALMGIASIGVVSLFGDNVRILFAASANALAGKQKVRAKTQEAHQRHRTHKNLENFGEGNQGAS